MAECELACCSAAANVRLQVVQVTELLQATCGRYHDLLGGQLQQQLEAAVGADVLGELIISSEQQHAARVAEFGLPWQLEGAGEAALQRSAAPCCCHCCAASACCVHAETHASQLPLNS